MKAGPDADARAAGNPRDTDLSVSPRSEAQPSEGTSSEPPPLRRFGLRLHHDGRWSHEGQPILNRRLREHFDRSVRYLPAERKYVVTLRHFRGEIEVEEAAFFVRTFDATTGRITLSDRSEETLAPVTLSLSPLDGALLCRVKRDLDPNGLPTRFTHAAHTELMLAVEGQDGALVLRMGGMPHPLPELG